MVIKLSIAWPANFVDVAKYVPSSCSMTSVFDLRRLVQGEQSDALAIPVLLTGVALLAPMNLKSERNEAGVDQCSDEKWASNILSPILATLVALLIVGMPLMTAKAAHLLAGSWSAGVPAAWVTAIFERFTGAVGFGEFEIVLAAGLFTLACVAAATWLSKTSGTAALVSAIAFACAALIEPNVQIVMLVALPLIPVILALYATGEDRTLRAVRALVALLATGVVLGALLIGLQMGATGQPVIQKASNVRAVAQRVGMANAQHTRASLRALFAAPPAPGLQIGDSKSVYERLTKSRDKLSQEAYEISRAFLLSPLSWTIQSIVLATHTGWRLGYFFFFAALVYLPASWKIAQANGQLGVWLLIIFPVALMVVFNAVFGTGHWINALAGIVPIAVIPAHIWRGL